MIERRRMEKDRITNRDNYYWDILKDLADEENKVEAPAELSLEEFLCKRKLHISTPTLRALLKLWESKEWIKVERGGFHKNPVCIRIIPSQKRINLLTREEAIIKNKVVVLLDFDNLNINWSWGSGQAILEALNGTLKNIAKEIGPIPLVFVICPYHIAITFGEAFYKAKFWPIFSPKIKTKQMEEKDTADESLIEFGKKIIAEMPGLTHLCLGSGDKDFIPLLIDASRQGLDIAIIASDSGSLANELVELADSKPDGKEKMIYFLKK